MRFIKRKIKIFIIDFFASNQALSWSLEFHKSNKIKTYSISLNN